jgi:hypothetical protein
VELGSIRITIKLEEVQLVKNVFSWSAPKDGFVKLNGDGSVNNHGALVACGGIVRNADGVFIWIFL